MAEAAIHIDSVRTIMLDQLRALRAAPAGEALTQELKRSKGISELSQTFIDSARVEVEYQKAICGDGEVPVLSPKDSSPQALQAGPSAHNPFGQKTVHRLKD